MISKRLVCTVVICLVLLLLAAPAGAQNNTGGITVNIVAMDGTPLAAATARLSSPQYSRSDYSDEEGRVRFLMLPAGVYKLKVSLEGYQTAHKPNIVLKKGQKRDIRVIMMRSMGQK